MGQKIQLKLNNNNVSPESEIVGNGQLVNFTATDLTGAANELKTSITISHPTVTATSGNTVAQNTLCKIAGIVIGTIRITSTVSAGVFTQIASVDVFPKVSTTFIAFNSSTNEYCGLLQVASDGKINLTSVTTIYLNNVTALVAYEYQ